MHLMHEDIFYIQKNAVSQKHIFFSWNHPCSQTKKGRRAIVLADAWVNGLLNSNSRGWTHGIKGPPAQQ